jgi:hypothetical protein
MLSNPFEVLIYQPYTLTPSKILLVHFYCCASLPAQFLAKIDCDGNDNQLTVRCCLASTYFVDVEPFEDFTYQPYTHAPSLFV